MAKEGSGALVVRNTLANGIGTFSGVLVSLLLTPFLIAELGKDGFGIWALALSLSFLGGYASMTDLGVETSAARYVAEARSDGDVRAARETGSTAMAFFGAVALVAAPILALLAFPLTELFNVREGLESDATWCFALIGAHLLLELPARVYFAVLEGAQRYDMYQLIELIRALSQAGLFAGALIIGLDLPGLGAAMVLSSGIVLVAGWAIARRIVPEMRMSPRYVSRSRFKTIMTFGGQYFFIRLMGTIYRQIDKAIVGIALSLSAVTFYEVANRIHQGAAMVQSVAASSLLPATAYLRERTEILRELYLRGTNYTVAVALPVVVAAFVFAEDLIRTWVGESLTDSAGSARLFLVFVAFVTVHATGAAMIVALGRMRFVLSVTLVFTIVNLGVSIALVGPLEVNGVILGTVIAQAVIWVPYTLYFFRTFEVGLGEWARRVLLPNVPGLVAQLATAWPLLYLADRAGHLALVLLLVLVSVAVSLAAYFAFGLRREDRLLLTLTLKDALGLGKREPEPGAPVESHAAQLAHDTESERAAAQPTDVPPFPD